MNVSTTEAPPSCGGSSVPGTREVTWQCKETIRSIYDIDDCHRAGEFVDQLTNDLQDSSMPLEVRALGRTIARWRDQIVASHRARVCGREPDLTGCIGPIRPVVGWTPVRDLTERRFGHCEGQVGPRLDVALV